MNIDKKDLPYILDYWIYNLDSMAFIFSNEKQAKDKNITKIIEMIQAFDCTLIDVNSTDYLILNHLNKCFQLSYNFTEKFNDLIEILKAIRETMRESNNENQ